MTASNNIQAIGKRKTAMARVYLRSGNGRILVNHRKFEEYFPMETTRNLVRQPLALVNAGAGTGHSRQCPGRGAGGPGRRHAPRH